MSTSCWILIVATVLHCIFASNPYNINNGMNISKPKTTDLTPSPTQKIYPCDFIDPNINGSNCGACVANSSCTWCTVNNTCHVTAEYDKSQCVDPKTQQTMQTISGGQDHLFQCCETSNTCEQCSTLYYVQCNWCITSHTCFNSSRNQDCNGGSDDNGKYIVWKDGWCHGYYLVFMYFTIMKNTCLHVQISQTLQYGIRSRNII